MENKEMGKKKNEINMEQEGSEVGVLNILNKQRIQAKIKIQ